MPQVSAPQMPQIQSPTLGSSFYQPAWNYTAPTTAPDTQEQKDSQSMQTKNDTALQIQNSPLLQMADKVALQGLSSSDIFALESNSLLSVKSLLERQKQDDNDTVLQNILKDLAQIKATLATDQKDNITKPALYSQNKNRSLLRFLVNGVDIQNSCKSVYFSKTPDEKRYFLTFDQNITINQKRLLQTAYFLFTLEPKIAPNTYTVSIVTSPLLQEKTNTPLSFFSKNTELIGYKTGHLLSVHYTGRDFCCDILLDCGAGQ